MLSFDAEVLAALFAQMNRALWPAQTACFAAALAALWLASAKGPGRTRLLGAVLAGAWLICGLVFHLHYFAGLSFTAPAFGGLFLAQAALLAWSLLLRGRPAFGLYRGPAAWAGLAAIAYALVVVPLISLLGEGPATTRVFALAPGPTAVFTLGLLLLSRGRCPLHLLLLPLAWTLIAGATAWSLWIPEDLALPVIGPGLVAVAFWHNRTLASRADP